MANLFEAQLELPANAHAPQPWDQSDGVGLQPSAVISRDEQGEPLSYVGDFVWNWKFYTPRKKTSNLDFFFWKKHKRSIDKAEITEARKALIQELQYLMVLRIYFSARLLSFHGLNGYLYSLRKLASFAEERECSVFDVLEQSAMLDAFIDTVPSNACATFIGWINFLSSLAIDRKLLFTLAVPKKFDELIHKAKAYRDNYLQTAPIPTRIYLALINALSNELDDIEAHRDRILNAFREGVMLHRQHESKGILMAANFGPDLIAKYDLQDFLDRHAAQIGIRGLTTAIVSIFRICKLQIHTFSGMRDEEVEHLPYHCMDTVKLEHGRSHSLIVGVTTKLAGARRKRTRWVTTEAQGFRAIRLAQSFSRVIYEALGAAPSSAERAKDDFPLFVSTSYLPWMRTLDTPSDSRYMPSSSLGVRDLSDEMKSALCSIIEADDIEELEAVDPFRDWNSEPEFAIGMPWPLKSHQLRRSLALYANASGLVMTSSLRRQLQHITREMSEYYGRGSVFAKNFLSDDPQEYKNHICVDWQDSEQEAQYLAFTRDVLNSDEPLCGPAGLFYDLKKQRGEVMSGKEVKAQLKMGRLAYKTHPLGGCTHIGTCDKQKGLRLTSGICISESCKSLVGKHSKILKLIPIQREIVSRIDPDSIAFRMEKEELEILEAAEVQWRPENRVTTALPGVTNV